MLYRRLPRYGKKTWEDELLWRPLYPGVLHLLLKSSGQSTNMNASDARFPDFLVIGAQKAGTTWLWTQLKKNDDIWMPPIKELHYFDRNPKYPSPSHLASDLLEKRMISMDDCDLVFRKKIVTHYTNNNSHSDEEESWYRNYFFGTINDQWYASLFSCADGKTAGEITPSYSILNEDDVCHIASLNPNLKIIFILRDPIERAWSSLRFRHFHKNQEEELISIVDGTWQSLRSDYLRTLEIWSKCFRDEQLFIVFFDRMKSDPVSYLKEIYAFLNVKDTSSTVESTRASVNKSIEHKMPASLRKHLVAKYLPVIEKLHERFANRYTWSWIEKHQSKCRFVLITTQRSGSTLLSEYLNSHPDIYMGRELFQMHRYGYNYDEEGYVTFQGPIADYLDSFFSKHLQNHQAVGFKLMSDQMHQFPQILEYIKVNGIPCIYLERQNSVKIAVSRLLARKRNLYHTKEDIVLNQETLCIDQLNRELSVIASTKEQLRNMVDPDKDLQIYYEELVIHKESVLLEALSFLQVSQEVNLQCSLRKINSENLKDVIANYDDLLTDFLHTKYLPQLRNISLFQRFNTANKCLFIHIPKVAGSSIESALFSTKGVVGHKRALIYKQEDPLRFDRYFSFAFVRNPYDRFVSAYEYLVQGGRNKFDKAWSDKHLAHHDSFKAFVMSFRDENTKLHIIDWMHFKPQYLFVCDNNGQIIVDMIGKYENLETDFLHITEKLRLKASLPHENACKRGNYRDYFDNESCTIIRNVYAKDFEMFGYDERI